MKLKHVRHRLGLTQTKMGEILGMSQATVAVIESGRRKETIIQQAFLELIEACRQHDLKHPDCQILSAYDIKIKSWPD